MDAQREGRKQLCVALATKSVPGAQETSNAAKASAVG